MTTHPVKRRKKLIEVAIPLEAINAASAREKSIRHGHPSTLHLWWARRPLAAARAVIFCQMVDDPSAVPEEFPTEEDQENERLRLFALISELVTWENTTNEQVLNRAREEIKRSWRRACADNAEHPEAAELFNPETLPGFHDPFAGGGALPLEAQRLGLESYASDLNPVAVLINKAMIEIPPKFAGMPPVNPEARSKKQLIDRQWKGAEGLAEDVRYYGKWMRDEAEKRIGNLYPNVTITPEIVDERPDLKPYLGEDLTVIAWIWARTVKSPNPAFAHIDVPLASTFMLSSKVGREVYVQALADGGAYRFKVRTGSPLDFSAAKNGTKLARGANFACLLSGAPIQADYIKSEGKSGRLGSRLIAIVAEGKRSRIYLSPTPEQDEIARQASPEWKPENTISGTTQYLGVKPYGLTTFDRIFTNRQLVALSTFSSLIDSAKQDAQDKATIAGLSTDETPLSSGGKGARAYSEALAVYLSFVASKTIDGSSTICRWMHQRDSLYSTFSKQALQMTWDYAEINVLANCTRSFLESTKWTAESIEGLHPSALTGFSSNSDAAESELSNQKVVSTDPPYYDNIPYADLSDFFYVWLRRSLRDIFPALFATLESPKREELVAAGYRHGGKEAAQIFFLNGMTKAMGSIARNSHPGFPVTVYYAFKEPLKNPVN